MLALQLSRKDSQQGQLVCDVALTTEQVYLFDLYDITNENARLSAAVPWPINVFASLVDLFFFFVVNKSVPISRVGV